MEMDMMRLISIICKECHAIVMKWIKWNAIGLCTHPNRHSTIICSSLKL